MKIGVLGCVAEAREGEGLLEEEKLVDLVVGPRAYRDLQTESFGGAGRRP